MLTIYHFYTFATALMTTTILVPIVSHLSGKFGGFDAPDARKIHTEPVPRLGGIAIFSGLLFTSLLFFPVDSTMKGLLVGAIVIFLTGLADDLVNLSPCQKFVGEFMAAGLAVFIGDLHVQNLGNPFGAGFIELGYFSYPFTIFGLVGLMNAVNLMDGLDGLASSVCAIATVAFAIISFRSGNGTLFSLSTLLLGVLLGFLRYNNYPATIFMGDCGSLLLGYCMGVFSLLLVHGGTHPVSPFIPLLILWLPILDTLVVMIRRRCAGKKMFSPDRSHIHHRLLDLGFGHKYSVLCVVGISYLLSFIAIYGYQYSDTMLLIMLTALSAAVYFSLQWLAASGLKGAIDLGSDQTFISSDRFRLFVSLTGYLTTGIKYLLLLILLLPLFLTHNDIYSIGLSALVLLVLAVYVLVKRQAWGDQLLQVYIGSAGCILLFATENYGRDNELFGIPLLIISNFLFLLLLICEAVKIFLRNRSSRLLVSPLEYLLVFIVLCMPLLPAHFTGQFHLLTVAAKSVIMFVGFKLVLMRQIKRNRKIIVAITLSLLIIGIRYLVSVLS